MFQQLVQRMVGPGVGAPQAALSVLTADPMDLVLHMEQVWNTANVWAVPAPPAPPGPAGDVRRGLWAFGRFNQYAPVANPAWDHLGYAFALENTRAVQILHRVVRELRSGENLGIPSVETQRWLDATEAVLFGGLNLFSAWLSSSAVRPDPEAVRRNAYWRLFGMDLAFGTEDNKPFAYQKAGAANTTFVSLFEELLAELWQAMANIRNSSGPNQADNDRIYRLAEQLGYILRVRRQNGLLAREELAAVSALGWVELSLSANTPVVLDLRAEATNAGDRLQIIGQRVGMAPHSRAGSFFAMAEELSLLLRTLEAGYVSSSDFSWLLYADAPPPGAGQLPPGAVPLGVASRRVITEWSAASGKDLKARKVAVQTTAAPVSPAMRSNGRQPALTRR